MSFMTIISRHSEVNQNIFPIASPRISITLFKNQEDAITKIQTMQQNNELIKLISRISKTKQVASTYI